MGIVGLPFRIHRSSFQFHDAFTGELRYSESFVLGLD